MWRLFVSIEATVLCVALTGYSIPVAAQTPFVLFSPGTGRDRDPVTALVLPAKTGINGKVDSAAIDILLTSGLEDLGVQVMDIREGRRECNGGATGLGKARESYLDMDLEKALAQADEVREFQLEVYGDLLECPYLIEAELFMVQILLDLGKRDIAAEMAGRVLERHPLMRLDPAKYSPVMQSLWADTVAARSPQEVFEPDGQRLIGLGQKARVDWIVWGISAGSGEAGETLSVLLVPVNNGDGPVRHTVMLGSQGRWATSVRAALALQFPPPAGSLGNDVEMSPVSIPMTAATIQKTRWYKSWWFWTIVGVAVVGGTAGAVGGYYANQDHGSGSVEYEPPW